MSSTSGSSDREGRKRALPTAVCEFGVIPACDLRVAVLEQCHCGFIPIAHRRYEWATEREWGSICH